MNKRPYGILIATIFTLLFLLFMYRIAEILLLLFIAVLFSLYLSSITDALQRRFRIPRPAGLLIALSVTALAVVAIGWMLMPALLSQTEALLQTMPVQFAKWEAQLRAIAENQPMFAELLGEPAAGETYVGQFAAQVTGYFSNFERYLFSGIGFLIHFISVLVMGIYMTLRPGLYREGLIALFPPVHRELARDILDDLNRTLRAWIVGQLLAMLTMGLFTWIGFYFLNVPYALAFSVFTGAAAIVPFFGTIVSTILPAIVVIGAGGPLAALLVLLWGVVVHLFEANFVAPMIMERQVSLPPVLTLLSVLIMGHLLHFIGLLVAVPVLATVLVIVRRIYIQRMLEGRGFRRAVRDQAVQVQLPEGNQVLVHPSAFERSVPAVLEG
ncbi:MAG TPA: AI-2E family transporter [Longimicrobiales bacterium]|nr:AI-2E family transporter [Longimicrobiales bacterium]